MDALLRYILYNIAYGLLALELVLMLSCCLAIILVKLITRWVLGRRERIQKHLDTIIEGYLFGQQPLESIFIPLNLQQYRNLVETLERYDQRFNDPRWIEIKEKIVSKYLLPKVEAYASSYSWVKRQLVARTFLLCPHLAKEHLLEKLLNDSKYLVRVTAAVCITQTNYKKLFYEVIHHMSKETLLSQFSYRDALIQVNQEKYEWIESLLSTSKDKKITAICLDVLSTRYSRNLLPIIRPYVNDVDQRCRLLAIRALGNVPNEEAIHLLENHLNDSDWEIRAESVLGLQKLYAVQAIPKITLLLKDPIWWVRLQAALTLKNFGKDGKKILNNQDLSIDPAAYEISQYVLALP